MPDEQTLTQREGAPAAPSQAPSGTGLELKSLTKRFGEDVAAVDDVNLHIAHGEYVVLLGPSGCGKTTTLRMIGGHEEPTNGDIVLDGQSLLGLPPDKRPTTTVFQHFALFPHRTVRENVEFGPKMRGISKAERREKAMSALDMVGLRPLARVMHLYSTMRGWRGAASTMSRVAEFGTSWVLSRTDLTEPKRRGCPPSIGRGGCPPARRSARSGRGR